MVLVRPWTAMVLLSVALTAGCVEEDLSPPRAARGKMVVETFPPPVDPALLPPRAAPAPPETVIIENGPKCTIIYTCRYARCETLKEAIESFTSPEGTIQASPALNVLLIADNRESAPALLQMVEELDRPVPQLLVEAKILEITLDSDFEYELKDWFTQLPAGFSKFVQSSGILLTTPGANPNPTLGGLTTVRPLASDSQYLDLFIRLLVTRGNAKILSSPNLIVSAGTEASIITGEEVPIQSATVVSGSVSTTTSFKRVGIKLRVTPLQITGDTARVDINPEVSTVTGYTAAGASGISNPIVALRNVRSVLSMKDGETLTIGGLLRSEDRKVARKVPGLGDIPGLGLLFQSRRDQTVRTQLIFFLRVNILPEGRPYTLQYHRPGAGMEGVEDRSPEAATQAATQPGPAQPADATPPRRPPPRVIILTPAPAPAPDPAPDPATQPAPDPAPPPPAVDPPPGPTIFDVPFRRGPG